MRLTRCPGRLSMSIWEVWAPRLAENVRQAGCADYAAASDLLVGLVAVDRDRVERCCWISRMPPSAQKGAGLFAGGSPAFGRTMKATVSGLAGKGCGTVVWHGERLRRAIAAPVAAVAVASDDSLYHLRGVVDRNAEAERRASECAEIAAQAIEYAWSFVGENCSSAGRYRPFDSRSGRFWPFG